MATSKPDMSLIWASAGSSVQPSDAKIQEGWTAEKPPFQTENWSQQRQDQYLKHIDERGIPEWDNLSEYEIGAVAWYQDKIWESLTTPNIGNAPVDGMGFWLSQDYLDSRGGTMTGELITDEGIVLETSAISSVQGGIKNRFDSVVRVETTFNEIAGSYVITLYDAVGAIVSQLSLSPDGILRSLGSVIWSANNMGPGTGLNADLLDGMQLQALLDLITSAGNSGAQFTQYIDTTGTYNFPTGITRMQFIAAGGGGGGGGGGDGGNASGSDGGAGAATTITWGTRFLFAAGGGGGGGGLLNPAPGAGGLSGESHFANGGSTYGVNKFNGEDGSLGSSGFTASGGNGGSGSLGRAGVGDLSTGTILHGGYQGGGGAGSWGQDSAPGGGGASSAFITHNSQVGGGVTTFDVVIGSGGAGGNGSSGDRNGNAGGNGWVLVTFYL